MREGERERGRKRKRERKKWEEGKGEREKVKIDRNEERINNRIQEGDNVREEGKGEELKEGKRKRGQKKRIW
jgi:hypothetical protein